MLKYEGGGEGGLKYEGKMMGGGASLPPYMCVVCDLDGGRDVEWCLRRFTLEEVITKGVTIPLQTTEIKVNVG